MVTDDPAARFQWERNRVVIPEANQSSLRLPSVSIDDEGHYAVLVSNDFGEVYSREAQLQVAPPPVITGQPADSTVNVGGTTNLGLPQPDLGHWPTNGMDHQAS